MIGGVGGVSLLEIRFFKRVQWVSQGPCCMCRLAAIWRVGGWVGGCLVGWLVCCWLCIFCKDLTELGV